MPCFSIRTVSVDLTVANEAILLRALTALNLQAHAGQDLAVVARRIIADGRVTFAGSYAARAEELATQIKTAYAQEAVKAAAKQNGWAFTTNKQTGQATLNRKSW